MLVGRGDYCDLARMAYSAAMLKTYLSSHVPMPWGHIDTDVFAAWGQWAGGCGSILAVAVALYVAKRMPGVPGWMWTSCQYKSTYAPPEAALLIL
jgi:hypothetical protein